MTQPGAVRVTVARVCPAGCKDGRVAGDPGTFVRTDRGMKLSFSVCPTCHGRGVVDDPVTCGDCAHWVQDDSVCQLFTRIGWVEADQERETPLHPWCTCDDLDIPKQNQIVYADADFACKAWEPREPRS